MGRGSLDVGLLVLCTEAERAAIVLTHHADALPDVAAFGYDALDAPQRLTDLAAAGREAHTAANRAKTTVAVVHDEGRALAEVLYDFQSRARQALGAAALHPDAAVRAEATMVRRGLTLHAPRLQGGLDGVRSLRDALQRGDSPLVVLPALAALRDEAARLADEGRALVARTQTAVAASKAATRARTAAGAALQDELRTLRASWKAAQAMGAPLPDLVFELARLARSVPTSKAG